MIKLFSKYKFIFYTFNILVIVLYLFPGSLLGCLIYSDCSLQPQITPDYIVSSNHLYAFLLLSTIGFFTFTHHSQFFSLSLYLIFLSVFLELLHFFIPGRNFEFLDLFGNSLGVIVVIISNYFIRKIK